MCIRDRSNSNALRKNKAFLQLQREMEQRNRQKRKTAAAAAAVKEEEVAEGAVAEEVFYVDRDRAAAVAIGNKDIKKDLNASTTARISHIFSFNIILKMFSFFSTKRNATAWRMRPLRSLSWTKLTMKLTYFKACRNSSKKLYCY